MIYICVGFDYVTGYHTGVKIRKHYNKLTNEFNIKNKVFKVVTDQAANMKKAYEHLKESELKCVQENCVKITNYLLDKQHKLDKLREAKAVAEMEEEINKANSFKSSDQPKVSKYYRAEEVRLDFDDNTDELSEEESFFEKDSDCESEATEEDVDLDFDIDEAPKVDLAYLPCAAHNIQLVVNDG